MAGPVTNARGNTAHRDAVAPAAPHRQRGFTLTELFAVVAIAAVLAAIAIPNMSEFIKNNARATRLNLLVTAFNLARSDAISRRRTVTVCASANASTCAGNNQFHNGFVARLADGTVLRAFVPDGDGFTMLGFEDDGVTALTQVVFAADGFPDTVSHPSSIANFFVRHCDDRGTAQARAVVLTATGHPRMSTDSAADADSTHDVAGANLACP